MGTTFLEISADVKYLAGKSANSSLNSFKILVGISLGFESFLESSFLILLLYQNAFYIVAIFHQCYSDLNHLKN